MITALKSDAAPPNRLQRTTLTALFATAIVLVALSGLLALRGLYEAQALLNVDQIHEYTGKPKDEVVSETILFVTALLIPFPVFATLAVMVGRARKRQRLNQMAVRVERALSGVGSALALVFTRERTERLMSATGFVLSFAAVYQLFGLSTAFSGQEQAIEEVALGFLMPIDPIIFALAVPAIILGSIARKFDFGWSGLGLTATIIATVSLVLSFTKVGAVMPIITQSIVQAFSLI